MQQIRGRPIDLIDELDGQAIDNGPVNGTSRTERLKELHSSDPVICRLEELGRILRERSDGGVDIHCPFEAQHTTQGGKGDCTYWPPNTGSFTCGHFKCLHSHCDKRRDDEFLAALELHQTALLNGESLGPPELSDDALADVFAQRHAQDWRYVAAWGQWLRWDGRRWTQDRTLAVVELVRHICREAAAILGNVRLARQVASAKTVMAVKHIARADPRIAATPEQWDARDFLLNTPGGTVDLHTGMLRLHQREDYLTKIAGVAPNASMPHPNFQRFLKDVTCGDEGLATYLRRIAGYCLTGDCREQVLILCVGVGANGKSTLLDALCYVFGDYAKVIAAETLLESRNGRHPTEIANLMGVRLALSSELEEGQAWSEARIKALTGDERLAGRFMRQDFFDFRKTHKHIVAGNHRPGLRTVDTAIRRRMHLIPFEAKFTGETRDRHMLDKLRAEGPAILAWAIQGCVDWQKHGLSMPQKVMAATDEYLASMDLLQLWIDECCVTTDPTSREKSSALYASFAAWKAERGEGVPSHMRFSEWLQGAGFRKLKSTGGAMVFEGIALSAEEKRRLAEGL